MLPRAALAHALGTLDAAELCFAGAVLQLEGEIREHALAPAALQVAKA